MGGNYFTNPIIFIIDVVFDLYLLAVMLRFLLQWVRADFYNPLSQFLVKITNPPLVPLRKIIPGLAGIDLASVILMFVIASLKIFLITTLSGIAPTIVFIVARSAATLVSLFLNIYLFSIIILVIISWVAPQTYNPITVLLHQITQPLMRPIRRVIPTAGGIDLSPLVALVLIQVSKMILIPPLNMLS